MTDCVCEGLSTMNLSNTELRELLKLQREFKEVREAVIKCIEEDCREDVFTLEEQALFEKREESIGKIPKFWAVSLRNAFALSSSRDCDLNEVTCFDFLTKMSVEIISRAENGATGTKVNFYFEENNTVFENNLVSKVSMLNDLGDPPTTTTTPITWKLQPPAPCEENVQETGNHEKRRVFDWLESNDEAYLDKFLLILGVWNNPLQFYTSLGEPPESGYDDHVKRALEEIELCQQKVQDLYKTLVQEQMNKVKIEYESTYKTLCDKRRKIIQKMPHFWETALKNYSEQIAILGEEDQQFLKYIMDVHIESNLESDGIIETVYFYLSDLNPYVQNEALSKTKFHSYRDDDITYKSTPVIWKKGANRPEEDEAKTSEGQNTEGLKLINWFSDDIVTEYNNLVFSKISELWEDPLQYVIDVKNADEV